MNIHIAQKCNVSSEEGRAFANRDFGGKLRNSSANAQPLR